MDLADCPPRLEPLIAEISVATGVTEQNVLLFLGDGRELRDEVLEEAWERGGQATLSTVRCSLALGFVADGICSAASADGLPLQSRDFLDRCRAMGRPAPGGCPASYPSESYAILPSFFFASLASFPPFLLSVFPRSILPVYTYQGHH